MRYFVRKDKLAKVEGSFSVSELKNAVRSGELSSDFLASSDLGENADQLQNWHPGDWFTLNQIPDLRDLFPVETEAVKTPVKMETTLGQVLTTLFFVFAWYQQALEKGGLKEWGIFVLGLVGFILITRDYIQKKYKPSYLQSKNK